MKPAVIVFDLDDTICNLSESFGNYIAQKLKRPELMNHHLNWITYNLDEHYPGVDVHQMFEDFDKEGGMMRLPLTGIGRFLVERKEARKFASENLDEIHIVTARGWMRQGLADTHDYLVKNGVAFDHLHVTQLHESKAAKIPADCLLIYEDSPKNIEELRPLTQRMIIVDQPWNRALNVPDSVRIHPETMRSLQGHSQEVLARTCAVSH